MYRKYDSTITNERLKASKSIWPIRQIEQVFLPDFKMKPLINEHSFEVGNQNNIMYCLICINCPCTRIRHSLENLILIMRC